jgi:hypothetical protein
MNTPNRERTKIRNTHPILRPGLIKAATTTKSQPGNRVEEPMENQPEKSELSKCSESDEKRSREYLAWIAAELTAIGVMVGETVSKERLSLTANALSGQNLELLKAALAEHLATGDHFPKPGEIVRPIRNREFAADYAWLLRNLKEHGPTWKDSSERLGDLKRIPGMGPDDFYPRDVLEAAIPAPSMPPKIAKALEIYGHGDRESALREFYAHPDCKGGNNSESLRARRDLDTGFRAAWDLARSEV